MMRIIAKVDYLILLLVGSIMALVMAYIAQYGFDLRPCPLCLYQRIPYGVAIVMILIVLPFYKKPHLEHWILLVAVIIFAIEALIAGYHVGVEYKVFEGLKTCSDLSTIADSVEDLKAALLAAPPVRCDEPAFIFLGLSMAGWNMVYAFILATIGIVGFIKVK